MALAPALDTAPWHRIAAHTIGPDDAALSFSALLAHENRWSLANAEQVIGDYKRFCYLAVASGHDVTPSDAVDQARHLHLTYTHDYWQEFCANLLRAELHHGGHRQRGGSQPLLPSICRHAGRLSGRIRRRSAARYLAELSAALSP